MLINKLGPGARAGKQNFAKFLAPGCVQAPILRHHLASRFACFSKQTKVARVTQLGFTSKWNIALEQLVKFSTVNI
jgi:hypothetical protein